MIRWDLYRMLKNKWILLLIVGLLLFNTYIAVNTNYDARQIKEYNKYFEKFSGMDESELLHNEDLFFSEDESMEVAETAYAHVKENLEYDSYIDGVCKHADDLLQFPKYNTGFLKKNIEKTKCDFRSMKKIEIDNEPSIGILAILKTGYIDWSMLILILYLTMAVVLKERENNMLFIVRSTYNGKINVLFSRLLSILVIVTVVALCMLLGNYLFIAGHMPLGNLSRSVQSIYGFKDCMLQITVREYLFLLVFAKLLVYAVVTCVIYAFSVLSVDSVMLFVLTVVFFGTEELLYLNIMDSSAFVWAKYINVCTLMDSNTVLTKYININILGFPAGLLFLSIIVGCVTAVVCIMISYFAYRKRFEYMAYRNFRNALNSIRDEIAGRIDFISIHFRNSLIVFECKKMLISQNVWMVFILFLLVVQVLFNPTERYYVSGDEAWYQSYMKKLEGEITAEKAQYINGESRRFQSLKSEIAKSENIVEQVLLQQKLVPYEGFQRVQEQYQKLLNQGKKDFIYETGYQYLTFGNGMREDLYLAGILFVFSIASFAGMFEMEKRNRTDIITRTTYLGKKKIRILKYGLSIGLFTLMWIIVYGGRMIAVEQRYGLGSIMSDANCITTLSKIPEGVSILTVVILIHLFLYLLGMFMVVVILKLSEKLQTLGGIIIMGVLVGIILLTALYAVGS